MANQQIEKIEDINEAINPITPSIEGEEGLEILGHNRNQSVNLLRFSRSFFKIYTHFSNIYKIFKSLDLNFDNHIKILVSKTQHGHMSKEDKTKLDGVAENANNYKLPNASTTVVGGIKVGNNLQITADGTLSGPAGYSHPTSSGNKHIPSGGAVDNFIKWASDGTGTWGLINWDIIQNKPSSFTPASHTHDDRYFTEGEINEKFKNFCPIVVGALLILDSTANPATLYPNTTWSKIENRFLYGSASPSATGGRSSVALALANIPAHNHSASQGAHTHTANHNHTATQASHTHTQPTHDHISAATANNNSESDALASYNGLTSRGTRKVFAASGGTYSSVAGYSSKNGGDNTGSATPAITVNTTNVTTSSSTPSISVGNTGSGTSFDIMPPYYTVCIWKRLS